MPVAFKFTIDALIKHAIYSFEPIDWDYDSLTDEEKELLSREEFDAIKFVTHGYREANPAG